jgi:glycosyltransferase involved in cell wall biosynthesis
MAVGRGEGPQRAIAPDHVIYDFAPPSRLAAPFETFWLIWHLIGAIRRHRPDVLFCAGCTYIVVAAFVRLFMRGECPPIVAKLSNSLERRDLWWPARAAYWLWLRAHPHIVQCLVGMAPPMREEIRRCLNIASERIAIVPDPALNRNDMNALSVSVVRDWAGRRFVAVGRLTRQKNFALLLRAFAAMARADDRLLILGEGPQRKKLERLAVTLGIGAQVEMPGHLRSVVEVLTSADVFVTSSNYEGLPSVVVEALAAGLPIVATDCSACMDYLLGYGSLGRLVPIRDVRALAQAMSDAPGRDELSAAAMRKAAAQFTIERSAGIYLEVLAATAAGSAKAPQFTEAPASPQTA